ncbi:nucleoside transporter-like protein family [Xylogone sp. PMI_703]|nr:nucleoside transporter-like protein family [Xylogone sp. PMI_703]
MATSTIDRFRSLIWKSNDEQSYEPLEEDVMEDDGLEPSISERVIEDGEPFSWFEYSVFLLLGIAMLWAWNMFLAAAPYFQSRFQENEAILSRFQSAILSVSTITNLTSILVLANMQSKASYLNRIIHALGLNIVVFGLLAISAVSFRSISPGTYLGFLLLMVFLTSVATALCQNGSFAFAASFGRGEYIQAIMTGQGIAGVLPAIAQIVTVLAFPEPNAWDGSDDDMDSTGSKKDGSTSALIYFLTASIVSIIALVAVIPLMKRHNRLMEGRMMSSITSIEDAERANRKVVGLWAMFKKLYLPAGAVFICFTLTMFFPVFTQKIVSVIPAENAPRLFQPQTFIPLGFLLWNVGDFAGRLLTIFPFSLSHKPVFLFLFSIARVVFIPMYLLCNIENHGATIKSDAFYLLIVQLGFGLTNGWLSSSCMMVAPELVEDGEREAAGAFMVLMLVAGLTSGSFLSFTAANVS